MGMLARHPTILIAAALLAFLCVTPAAANAQSPVPLTPAIDTRPDIGAAMEDSVKLLFIEHAIRIAFQQKTRAELSGPFWKDYQRSVRVPPRWDDGDSWLVNYVGHPLHGAAAAHLWTAHDPKSRQAPFGLDLRYWATRWRALAFSAVYSAQFEFGPFSEASIGNVGIDPATAGWVDHVITPIAGTGLTIAEDALDKFFIEWFERHVQNRVYRAALRCIFNPARTMANTSTGRAPWHRDRRRLEHPR
jgi:hypothetical protein